MKADWQLLKVGRFTIPIAIAVALIAFEVATAAQTQAKPSGPSFNQALEAYSQATGRIILRASNIENSGSPFSGELPTDPKALAGFVESEAAKLGIEIIPDGELFARVLPSNWKNTKMGDYLGALKPPAHTGPPELGTISIKGGDRKQFLKIYAELRNCTVLYSLSLPSPLFWLSSQKALTKAEAVYAFETILALNGIAAVKDGEKFVQLVPIQDFAKVRTDAPPHTASPKSESAMIAAGTISFFGIDLNQFLHVYGELCNRTLLYPAKLSSPPFWITTQQELTKQEVIYALEKVLELSGIASARDGEKFVQLIPLADASMIKTGAPNAEAGDTEIDPAKVPTFRPGFWSTRSFVPPPASSPQITRSSENSPPGNADGLVAYYAKLTDREPIASHDVGANPIRFEVKKPVTKAQLLYAIEKTMALNGLAIVEVDGKSVRADRISKGK